MKWPDDDCLAEFRTRGECEMCRRRLYPLDPHHTFIKRGMGGATRLDLPENLTALCRICHNQAEHSHEFNRLIQAHVARRHGTTVEAIMDWLHLIIRTDKNLPLPAKPWSVAA